jgi:hypothetical protein
MSHIQQCLLVGCGVKDTSVRSNGVIGSSFWRASGSMCVASLPPFSFFLALQDSPLVKLNGLVGRARTFAPAHLLAFHIPRGMFVRVNIAPVFQREMHSVSKSWETSIGPFRAMAVVLSHTAEV